MTYIYNLLRWIKYVLNMHIKRNFEEVAKRTTQINKRDRNRYPVAFDELVGSTMSSS
jgi:hypothetical protein